MKNRLLASGIAILLLLPWLMDRAGLTDRKSGFDSVVDSDHGYPFLYREITKKKPDLDLLFMGSSLLWVGIDTPYVARQLSQSLHRPVEVATLGWNFLGWDFANLLFTDLLRHRKVKMVAVYLPADYEDQTTPHFRSPYYLQWRDVKLLAPGLGLADTLSLYAVSVLAAPRQLWGFLRPSDVKPAPELEIALGAWKRDLGFKHGPYERVPLNPPRVAADKMIRSSQKRHQYVFSKKPLPEYQRVMIEKFMATAKNHGVQVLLLHLPRYSEMASGRMHERLDWAKYFRDPLPMVAIPNSLLFPQFSDSDIQKFYYDDHLNRNGNEYFTRAIVPALEKEFRKVDSEGGKLAAR